MAKLVARTSDSLLARMLFFTFVALSTLAHLIGCGYATGGIVATTSSGGGSGGGSNSSTLVTRIFISEEKSSPARIEFTLADQESDLVDAEITFTDPNSGERRKVALVPDLGGGITDQLTGLETSPNGTSHTRLWAFGSTDQLGTQALTPAVNVQVRISGSESVLETSTTLGNDPPEITRLETPDEEGSGNVLVEFLVRDSSNDLVRVRAEYDIEGDEPDLGWQLARPAGESTTPAFAFQDLLAPETDLLVRFFWDTDTDLFGRERDVRMRFTAADDVAEGTSLVSTTFRIDNNEEPIVLVEEGIFIDSGDRTGGVSIPFTVRDDESDEVRLVFQWRRQGEPFPDLPADLTTLVANQLDPEERAALHLCTELPRFAEGRGVQATSQTIRLTEIGKGPANRLLAKGLQGRTISILRSGRFRSLSGSREGSQLIAPVAAVPLGEGLEALVLDQPSAGVFRLVLIDLATGIVIRQASSGMGIPTALTVLSRPNSSTRELVAFIASISGSSFRVDRIDFEQGSSSQTSVTGSFAEQGGIRAMTALGSDVCLVTVDDALLRVDFARTPPAAFPLLEGLSTPWGLVLDPVNSNHLYLSETGKDRILAVDLLGRKTSAIAAESSKDVHDPVLPSPRALALEQSGTRLLVVVSPKDRDPELRLVPLRTNVDLDGDGSADPEVTRVSGFAGDESTSIAIGPNNLRLLTTATIGNIIVAGGIEQRRTIIDYDPRDQSATVDRAFHPLPAADGRFRIHETFLPVAATPSGTRGFFTWDTSDVPQKGDVFVKAIPIDTEAGIDTETTAPKSLLSPLVGEKKSFPGVFGSAQAGDLDGDGDLDIFVVDPTDCTILFQSAPGEFSPVSAGFGITLTSVGVRNFALADVEKDGDLDVIAAGFFSLLIHLQTGPGQFDPVPIELPHGSVYDFPADVEVADVDGDGNLDLVTANGATEGMTNQGNTLSIFYQTLPGLFDPEPRVVGNQEITPMPQNVAVADLDGDGDLDLMSPNQNLSGPFESSFISLFHQTSPGRFDSPPLVLPAAFFFGEDIAPGDLDGDGDLDLMVSYGNGGGIGTGFERITVNLQIDTGVFETAPLILGDDVTTSGANFGKVSDVDGDGDLDLVANSHVLDFVNFSRRDHSAVFFQTSPGIFDPLPAIGPYADALTDLDGDGDVDFVTGSVAPSSPFDPNIPVSITLRQGSRSFFEPDPLVIESPTTVSPTGIVAGDMDGDGDLDLVVSSGEFAVLRDSLRIYFQTSPRVFNAVPLELSDPRTTQSPNAVLTADMDGDGDLEILSANRGGFPDLGAVTIFYQSGPSTFEPGPIRLEGLEPVDLDVGDFDHDGDQDIVVSDRASFLGPSTIRVYTQTSDRLFQQTLTLGEGLTDPNDFFHSVVLSDVNLDGNLDVCASTSLGSVMVFTQTSPGIFNPDPMRLDSPIESPSSSLEVVDFDGDGDVDFITASPFGIVSGGVTFFERGEAGDFKITAVPTPITGGICRLPPTNQVCSLDVDGDGDLDVASAVCDGIVILRQSSPGVFDPRPTRVGFPELAHAITPVDLDQDGSLDLLTAIRSANRLEILWGKR